MIGVEACNLVMVPLPGVLEIVVMAMAVGIGDKKPVPQFILEDL